MKKDLFLIIGLVVILAVSGFIFYKGKLQHSTNLESQEETASAAGEVVITYSNPGRFKEILRTVGLNAVVIEDFELDTIEVHGERKAVLNLIVSFDYQGKTRKLTIPVVDRILTRRLDKRGSEDLGPISVISLDLEKGSLINVALSYVPKDVAAKKEVVVDFCNARTYEPCLRYLKLGFGDSPIDFSEYLNQTLDSNQKVDYKIAFPNFIALLEN